MNFYTVDKVSISVIFPYYFILKDRHLWIFIDKITVIQPPLNLFTYFVIIRGLRTIYSQICVNFKILREDGDERVKGEWTRWKGKVRTLKTRSKLTQTHRSKITLEKLAQDSSKARLSEFTLVKLGFFSLNSLKRDVT